ncbi:transglycosylase SLT domain-containing protein [Pseudomonas gingeri]|uniref:baseplate hub protein n=1 Tax=Pseudomonas gingeri TaxID=117681 RepID=UPI0015A01F1D|nr:transglycosylase SLT domain-containing protein [Pseudomonas gingeri]NVZ64951.1 transglycosylase SLT domain-containing protein [Pseudomonas gingeri]NVZ73594.1 transglycosylase SLT domain-containing protein [Pseudomonas gingeri]
MRSRAWSVDINGEPYISLQSGSTQFRIQFNIDVSPGSSVSYADIRLYNLNKVSGIANGARIILKAGYTDNIDAIFTGTVTNVFREREPNAPEIITRLTCRSGSAAVDRGSAQVSLGPGARAEDAIRALAREWPIPIDIDNAQFADDQPMARGYHSGYGDIPTAMDNLAREYKFDWLQHMGRMYVTKPEMKRNSTAIKVNQFTGMIGIPEITRGPKGLGVSVSAQLNPSIMVNSVIDLTSEFATFNTGNLYLSKVDDEAKPVGEYNVFALRYSGDSHSDQWTVDIDGIRWGTKPDLKSVSMPENGKLYWGASFKETNEPYEPFKAKVIAIARGLSVDPNWLMAVMAYETGKHKFSPEAQNPKSSATGLIQFLEDTAKKLGTTTKQLSRMTATQQLDYVEKYYKKATSKPIRNLGDAYLAVLWPAAIGFPDTYVMWERDSGPYRREYKANDHLDKGQKGFITRGDAVSVANESYNAGGKRVR